MQRLRTPEAPAGVATKPLFDRLAGRYDRGNRAITLGQDLRWKRHAVGLLVPRSGGCYLDCGAGT
ncbi:MAG TPA: bifunctional demethylmenaquinone methyltransferase/2-methoxy-6-polyprenyl-1,4-benzoquinol methylase, partial [Candidatus Thermoplasmatota archaeon]|nr:bifunctional demethylmenaquinone methyltransferase/2-methoxy-6-polyprenyl-1,4-benzoquinol methylase [Candidatus Thermoplasmatota archaeon]